MQSKKLLLDLFLTFMKIGAFTFGGGYAMIPLIQKETVEKHGWISDDDILDIVAIAESMPGSIAINIATFVSLRVGGFRGAVCATFGMMLPSFLIITLVAYILKGFQDIPAVQYAFYGIRAGVLALIFKALWNVYRKCPKNLLFYFIAAGSFLAAAVIKINVLCVIIFCALVGLIAALVAERRTGA